MSVVLIADSDGERANAVADACQRAGMRVRMAAHGAAALEIALGEQPDSLVVEVDLPLIDGHRLAEILDANPRTHGLGVLFLGDGEARSPEGEGQLLPGGADPETVARFLAALQDNRRRSQTDAAGSEAGVEGQLSQIALPELLELFHVNRRTGVVELRQRSGRHVKTGRVWVRDGEILHATAGPVEAEKALFRLFTWQRGSFVFRPALREERVTIERPARALLREGARQFEERERLAEVLPPQGARLTLRVSRASLPNVLHPLTQEVLLLLELTDSVQGILDRSTFPDYQVLRTLQTLIRRGMVSVTEAAVDSRSQDPALAPGLAVRVRDWLEVGRPQSAPVVDAKIVLLAANTNVSATLSGVLGRMTGIELAPRRPHRIVAPLARISLEEDVGIELVDLSLEPGHAPSWRFVLHGAMAVVTLYTADTPPGSMQPVLDLLARRRSTRILHLVLEDKERELPEALAEQLASYDERTVLSMPLARPALAREALRELLSRCVA